MTESDCCTQSTDSLICEATYRMLASYLIYTSRRLWMYSYLCDYLWVLHCLTDILLCYLLVLHRCRAATYIFLILCTVTWLGFPLAPIRFESPTRDLLICHGQCTRSVQRHLAGGCTQVWGVGPGKSDVYEQDNTWPWPRCVSCLARNVLYSECKWKGWAQWQNKHQEQDTWNTLSHCTL